VRYDPESTRSSPSFARSDTVKDRHRKVPACLGSRASLVRKPRCSPRAPPAWGLSCSRVGSSRRRSGAASTSGERHRRLPHRTQCRLRRRRKNCEVRVARVCSLRSRGVRRLRRRRRGRRRGRRGALRDAADSDALRRGPLGRPPLRPADVPRGAGEPVRRGALGRREQGAASGRVYALGTIGSIIGTFGTTFVLIPALDVTVIAALFGGLLLVAALLVAEPTPRAVGKLGVTALVLLSATVVGVYGVNVGEDTLYQDQTAYSELRVGEDDGCARSSSTASATRRCTRTTATATSSSTASTPTSRCCGRTTSTGCCSSGRRLLRPEAVRQGVRRHRRRRGDRPRRRPRRSRVLRGQRGATVQHSRRGRAPVPRGDEPHVRPRRPRRLPARRRPFHLTTVEFMELAASKLDDDGALVANVISARSGTGSAFFRAELKTIHRAFPTSTRSRRATPAPSRTSKSSRRRASPGPRRDSRRSPRTATWAST